MSNTEPYHYKYLLLDGIVPVKLFICAETGLKAGAQVPDPARGQLRIAHDYMSRLEQNADVIEIDEETFNQKCSALYARVNRTRLFGGLDNN